MEGNLKIDIKATGWGGGGSGLDSPGTEQVPEVGSCEQGKKP